ncbi:MAG TPA: methyltransferase domain-containing protein [Candidatus Polarisedimenticolia bacterium]|jgi:SAM-dependent methyltransferase
MNSEAIKQRVRERYGAAADETGGCCAKTEPIQISGARSPFGCGDPIALMEIHPGETVLDVGSGPGADALAAARLVGPEGRVIGVDMTDAMLRRARENAAAAGAGNVEFRQGDADALPVEDGSVDRVISNCVINLVPDKRRAFREMFRALKPGGSFSISDLVGENLPASILEDPERYCSCIGGAPSEEAYLGAIRDAGFEQVRVVDRFKWEAPELAGTGGMVWSLKVAGRKPAPAAQGAR